MEREGCHTDSPVFENKSSREPFGGSTRNCQPQTGIRQLAACGAALKALKDQRAVNVCYAGTAVGDTHAYFRSLRF